MSLLHSAHAPFLLDELIRLTAPVAAPLVLPPPAAPAHILWHRDPRLSAVAAPAQTPEKQPFIFPTATTAKKAAATAPASAATSASAVVAASVPKKPVSRIRILAVADVSKSEPPTTQTGVSTAPVAASTASNTTDPKPSGTSVPTRRIPRRTL